MVVVWGRRRLGKSRLLTEWCCRHKGSYWVADESASAIQRKYLASELEPVFPGISSADYPDWSVLLDCVAREAKQKNWRGPLVLDEFPYLVAKAPELPSVLQRWIDREKREGGIVLALSGSSQCMMQSSILNSTAPLYGRADEILKILPILPGYINESLSIIEPQFALDYYTCWGGVPRYWELSMPFGSNQMDAVSDLVLSPLGVLHDEVDRLLRQEMPSAIYLRPILDAIGLGASKSSEIAGRLQTPATSITRALKQLQELGYIKREVAYGESEKNSKKSLYRISDPFLRLWFRAVAPHRGALQSASAAERLRILKTVWSQLRGDAWEDLCRQSIPYLSFLNKEWMSAGRHWVSTGHEWDVVSNSLDSSTVLLGECKSLSRSANKGDIDKILREMLKKNIPLLRGMDDAKKEYLIFIPSVDKANISLPENIHLITGSQVFSSLM